MSADSRDSVGLRLPRITCAWRVAKRVLLIVGVWYGLVLLSRLVMPRIADGSPAMPTMVLSWLNAHRCCAAQGVESFGDVAGSEALRRVAAGSGRRGGYLIQVFPSESGTVEAIAAYPRSPNLYHRSLVGRILLLDFGHFRLNTFLLTRDGQWYDSTAFSAAHPPTAADVALRDSTAPGAPWRSRGPLRATTPTATSARARSTNPATRNSAGGHP